MAQLLKTDTGTIDDATTFRAYVLTRAITPSGSTAQLGEIGNPAMLIAKPSTGVTIQATVRRDHGLETLLSTISLTPVASEVRVIRKFEAMTGADLGRLQVQLGDASAVEGDWSLDYLHAVVIEEGAR